MSKAEIIYNMAELSGCEAYKDEPMSRHTSFKIGGNAEAYIKVNNISQLKATKPPSTAEQARRLPLCVNSPLTADCPDLNSLGVSRALSAARCL